MGVPDAQFLLEPYFDAARDRFTAYAPEPGITLERLSRTRFLVRPGIHNSPRHFAACREDGRLIVAAPELADLKPVERVVAILAHELGHAADFAYPAHFWLEEAGKPASWKPPAGKGAARERRRWSERSAHEVELWADAVAMRVLGVKIQYSGPCLLQSFSRGVDRPAWLR